MTRIISINDRGTLTLPRDLRRRLGLSGSGQVVAEETEEGLLLRAGVTFPVELYSEKRVAEFARHNELALSRYRFKKQ